MTFKRALANRYPALSSRDFLIFWVGQFVSLIGTWMQSTAQGYLIYQLTNSPAYLGVVGFVGGLPSWLFMLFGGVVADRIPRRMLLVVTQVSMMVLAFVLAALTFTRVVQPWHIIILAFLLGVANAFDAPARVSFIVELVSREDMTNGIALNATMFNIATIAGPAIAGLTYAKVGPAWCFALNGLSFIAIIKWSKNYPFRWYGLWTMMAISLSAFKFEESIECARGLKSPGQQVFAKEGDELLTRAIKAVNGGDRTASESLLMKAVDWAKRNHYL